MAAVSGRCQSPTSQYYDYGTRMRAGARLAPNMRTATRNPASRAAGRFAVISRDAGTLVPGVIGRGGAGDQLPVMARLVHFPPDCRCVDHRVHGQVPFASDQPGDGVIAGHDQPEGARGAMDARLGALVVAVMPEQHSRIVPFCSGGSIKVSVHRGEPFRGESAGLRGGTKP